MNILVTGAAGFIGSHFSEFLLKKGHTVVALDNMNQFYDPDVKRANLLSVEKIAAETGKAFAFYAADIRHQSALKEIFAENEIQVVVHLAAMAGVRPSLLNPLLYEEVNQLGTINILEEARLAGVKKIVFASSSSVYGANEKTPFSESDPVEQPISYYAATKRAGELSCHVAHKIYGMSIAALRFFTVYGPRQRPDLAIHKFTKALFSGAKLPVYGEGDFSRDFTYVDDIIDGVYKAMLWVEGAQIPRYEIFNLGESRTASVKELIALLEKVTGLKAEIDRQPEMLGDVRRTFADITKAKKILGYDPKTELEAGLVEFVKWFRMASGV